MTIFSQRFSFFRFLFKYWDFFKFSFQVLLVGNMGLYDYRPYVKKVKNNRQIMFECGRGFKLSDGPPGATCIDGRWVPNNKGSSINDVTGIGEEWRHYTSLRAKIFMISLTDDPLTVQIKNEEIGAIHKWRHAILDTHKALLHRRAFFNSGLFTAGTKSLNLSFLDLDVIYWRTLKLNFFVWRKDLAF